MEMRVQVLHLSPPGAVAEAQEWQRRVDEVEARVWQVEDPESSLHSEIVRSFLCIDPHRPAAMVRRESS
jgi:hypothetical protein